MKLVMLRAPTKQTEVHYKGQLAKNDDFYEDVSTSTDFWLVFADALRKYFSTVEVWYQEDQHHERGFHCHSTSLLERWFQPGYTFTTQEKIDVLFVRGDHKDYYPVISQFPEAQLVYYPSGPYYCPSTQFHWDTCFVESISHIPEVVKKTDAMVKLFKKGCVHKYL